MKITSFLKEDNGKPSIKRLIAAIFTLLVVALILHYILKGTNCDEYILVSLLSAIFGLLGLSYIPSRNKDNNCPDKNIPQI